MRSRKGLDLSIILQKAVELIDRDGIDQISLAELAKALEVRTPSLYNHVKGLPALKQKLAIHGVHKLHEYMLHAAVGRAGDEAVIAVSKAYLQFTRTHPGLYEATFRAPDSKDPQLIKAEDTVLHLVMQVLDVYKLDEEVAIHMIRGLRSILHGFSSIEQKGGFNLPVDLDQSFAILMDTFLKGIQSMR